MSRRLKQKCSSQNSSNSVFAKCPNGFVMASGKSGMEFKATMAIREDNQATMVGKPKSADPRLV
jgi:hypothetical protein